LVLSAGVVFLLVNIYFIGVFIAMAATAAVLSTYANKAFGCVTGDILGATSELNRMISLLVLLVTMSY
jgi:adenosylcobinamide-GDP ribazoletransferase